MLRLQEEGAHNINFVTPTHVLPQILEALLLACANGLKIPLVYNTGGYDKPETISRLENIFDIYLPDMKYASNETASIYSDASDYVDRSFPCVREMHRQVGTLQTDRRGIAEKGLMVRHLVLPNGLAGSKKILEFLAHEISIETFINIMDQYHPACKAREHKELSRRTTSEEFEEVVNYARSLGLENIDT